MAAEYRPLMRERGTIGLRYRFYQNLHFRLHDYDVTDNSGEIYASYHLGPVTIRPHYRHDYTYMDLDPFSQIHQAGLDFFVAEASFLTLQPFHYCQYRDFLYPSNPASLPCFWSHRQGWRRLSVDLSGTFALFSPVLLPRDPGMEVPVSEFPALAEGLKGPGRADG